MVLRAIERAGVPDPVVNLVEMGPLVRVGERPPTSRGGHLEPAVFPRSKFPRGALVEVDGITYVMPRLMRWFIPMTLDATDRGLVLSARGKTILGPNTRGRAGV
jgi:hypothetical protein